MSLAAMAAVAEVNAAGGLLGSPVEMLLEDTASSEANAVTQARKLVTRDKVAVVFGGITSSARNAMKDAIVGRGRRLYFYPMLYEGKECTPNLYCTGPTPAQQCNDLVAYLARTGAKSFYLTGSNYIWPQTLNEFTKALITKAGGKVVGEEYFPLDQTDFTATTQKILASKADLVFNTTIPPGVVSVYRQLSEAGFQRGGGRIACVYMDETFVGLISAGDLEGTVSCLDYYPGLADAKGESLKAFFARESGGKVPFTAGTGATGMYRAIKLWHAAASSAKSIDPAAIAKALDTLPPIAGPGGPFAVAPGTRHLKMPMYVAVAKGGKFEVIERSKGAVEPGECRV